MILDLLLIILGIYFLIGFLFAIAFVLKGVEKVDEGAVGSSIGFRVLIVPGCMIFWPLLLKKWVQSTKSVRHD